jgi:cell division protein FtsI (penicillin-binding protein 3)
MPLLKQLQEYEADHGCVVVMETKTGKVMLLLI